MSDIFRLRLVERIGWCSAVIRREDSDNQDKHPGVAAAP
jgi:hypothetical protein